MPIAAIHPFLPCFSFSFFLHLSHSRAHHWVDEADHELSEQEVPRHAYPLSHSA